MNCQGCRCNTCARSAELSPQYFTPGEVEDVNDICYFCDDCRWWDGDYGKRSNRKTACEGYVEPKKYTESRAECEERRRKRADRKAQALRQQLKIIKGGKLE